MLDELIAKLDAMPEKERRAVLKRTKEFTKDLKFIPNPGPQTKAYYGKADITLFGGEPGGGKSGILIGLALNEYERSLIVRKQFTDLAGLLDNAKSLVGSDNGFVGGMRPKYNKPDGGVIHFEGLSSDGVDTGKQGTPRDFIGVDEGAQLTEKQTRLLFGWLRSNKLITTKKQVCRMIIASNPPLDPVGDWMIEFFGPWLNPNHPNPAEDGELRWFIFDADDKSLEVENSNPVVIDGKTYDPHSRTFIRSTVDDNPYIDSEEYRKKLQMMPEPYRTILLEGNFMFARKDQDMQLIPTDWVRQAQARWKDSPLPGVPMTAMGVDVARGGKDKTVIASRYDGWYAPIIAVPGSETPEGTDVAGLVVAKRKNNAQVVIDMGGGYGGAPLEHLKASIGGQYVTGHDGSRTQVAGRTKDRTLSFFNRRSQVWWEFREALDPSHSFIALPDDPELVADLTAPTFEIIGGKIKVESKGDGVTSDGKPKPGLIKRLGRSPDKGDAVVMAWSEGDRALTAYIQHNVPTHRYGNQRQLGAPPTQQDKYSNRR